MSYTEKDVAPRECRFAIYCGTNQAGDDMHVVKEAVHLKDGRIEPKLTFIKNYKRPFYITKPGFRKHKQKTEFERKDRVDTFTTRECDIVSAVKRALGDPFMKGRTLRDVCASPYVYYADITSTSDIKRKYEKKWPGNLTQWGVAGYDIETDVVNGTEDPILATLVYNGKAITTGLRSFFGNRVMIEDQIRKKKDQLIGEEFDKHIKDWEIVILDNPGEMLKLIFDRAHEWKPDLIEIWNIAFDIPKTAECLKKYGYEPKEVFSDPSVPPEFRFYEYIQDVDMRKTASGVVKPLKPHEKWHKAIFPATFRFVDGMAGYYFIRTGGTPNEQSYALNALLEKFFKDEPAVRKLEIEEAEKYHGIDKHVFMQKNYPVEYAVYNAVDSLSMMIMNNKILDCKLTIPMFMGTSDLEKFSSQPTRLVDSFTTYLDKKGYVPATVGSTLKTELDQYYPSLDGWITALNPHLVETPGLCVIEEMPHLTSGFYGHMADIDVTGSYPHGQIALNSSKETLHTVVHKIQGIPEDIRRIQGINLSSGITNATEFCVNILNAPTHDKLLKSLCKKKGLEIPKEIKCLA